MPLHLSDILYLLLLIVLFCVAYIVLFRAFPAFFGAPKPRMSAQSVRSIIYLVIASALAFAISYAIPDQDLGNRFLHAVGGGFLAFFTCFLAGRDSKTLIHNSRFIILSLLIVTALGVGNELLEFFLQSTTGIIFSPSATDTWLDLTSNTVGALIAAACLVPLVGRAKK